MKNSTARTCFSIKGISSFLTMLILGLGSSLISAQDFPDDSAGVFTQTTEEIRTFGDYSVAKALWRFPGVQASRDGIPNLRGVGENSLYVTVNGSRLANTGLGNRFTALSTISTDIISQIELIRVLSPDMQADALSGVVNLNTYASFDTLRSLEIGIGGGTTPAYFSQDGFTGRAWARYKQPLSESTFLALNVNYQNEQRSYETLGFQYNVIDFGSGPRDVFDQVAPGFQSDTRQGIGSSLQINYQPNQNESYFVRGFLNLNDRDRAQHREFWAADEGWTAVDSVEGGSYNYDLRVEDVRTLQFVFDAGGRNTFNNITLEYLLAWSQGTIESSTYIFPFQETGFDYALDLSNSARPGLSPVEAIPGEQDLGLETLNLIVDNHVNNSYTAKADAELPLSSGMIKVGSSAFISTKDANELGAYSQYDYEYRGSLNLAGFELLDRPDLEVFDGYHELQWMIDPEEALSFFETSIPNMRLDRELFERNSGYKNYFVTEQIFSGYGMADFQFGSFEISGGLRAEYTAGEYEGRRVRFNRFNIYEETSDTTVSNSYLNIFPNAKAAVNVGSGSVSLAYSRGISRPGYNILAPFELTNAADTSVFKGNPQLEPVSSDNLDFSFQYDLNGAASFYAGGFYRMLNNYIIEDESQVQIQPGQYPYFGPLFEDGTTQVQGYERSFINMDEAVNIYGFELSLESQFVFLPGKLSNIGTFINYTWSQSDFSPDGREGESLLGQSPHVINAALRYQSSKLSTQLSYHWTAERTVDYASGARFLPAANATTYPDQFEEGAQDVSFSANLMVNSYVSIWANVYNLLSTEQVAYEYDQNLYPTSIYLRDGIEFSLGLTLNF